MGSLIDGFIGSLANGLIDWLVHCLAGSLVDGLVGWRVRWLMGSGAGPKRHEKHFWFWAPVLGPGFGAPARKAENRNPPKGESRAAISGKVRFRSPGV
jgi:hypothetical protein